MKKKKIEKKICKLYLKLLLKHKKGVKLAKKQLSPENWSQNSAL